MAKASLTAKEATLFLGISETALIELQKAGLISASRGPNGRVRFERAVLEDYKKRQVVEASGTSPESSEQSARSDSGDSQLGLFELPPRVIKTSDRKHTKIWTHRHIPEDADLSEFFSHVESENANEAHPDNTLNDLPGKEWVRFQSSWFLFNALREDLEEERQVSELTDHHPATFSPTMIGDFILFFTKAGQVVLDPFVGIGSTLVACERTGRKGVGIELSPKYAEIARLRTRQTVIEGDCRKISEFKLPTIDFCVTSPPYWNVLNRSTKDFHKEREAKGFDKKYSDEDLDIGNIQEYNAFIETLHDIFGQIYKLMRAKAYLVVIIKNVKKRERLYPLAWDLARRLGELYVLKDEKIWVQDKVKLAPYGYPHAWVSNIHHHYCLVFRKE